MWLLVVLVSYQFNSIDWVILTCSPKGYAKGEKSQYGHSWLMAWDAVSARVNDDCHPGAIAFYKGARRKHTSNSAPINYLLLCLSTSIKAFLPPCCATLFAPGLLVVQSSNCRWRKDCYRMAYQYNLPWLVHKILPRHFNVTAWWWHFNCLDQSHEQFASFSQSCRSMHVTVCWVNVG